NLDGAHPPRLRDSGFDNRLVPLILRLRLYGELWRLDQQIGRTKLAGKVPHGDIRPLLRRRHVLRIALRRTGRDPLEDRIDLRVAERAIVLEFLNPYALVEMPRRHLSGANARANRTHPRAHVFITDERHRSHRLGSMTRFTFFLEDGG